jgi:hypothetical protein
MVIVYSPAVVIIAPRSIALAVYDTRRLRIGDE